MITENLINRVVKKVLNEEFNQYSDDDFASSGDPYGLVTDDELEEPSLDGYYTFNRITVEIKNSGTQSPTIIASLRSDPRIQRFMKGGCAKKLVDKIYDDIKDYGDVNTAIYKNTNQLIGDQFENIIRESVKRALKENYATKYEHFTDILDYYGDKISDGHTLSREQKEQIGEILDWLEQTNAHDNPAVDEWIRLAQELIGDQYESIIRESVEDLSEYTHLAVNKETNLIVYGWDYKDEDPQYLRMDKKYYFTDDLVDYGFNPKAYKIIGVRFARKNGINQWSNTGVFPLPEENRMAKEDVDFHRLAHEQHPDWFID